jgi:hypothetical protein
MLQKMFGPHELVIIETESPDTVIPDLIGDLKKSSASNGGEGSFICIVLSTPPQPLWAYIFHHVLQGLFQL